MRERGGFVTRRINVGKSGKIIRRRCVSGAAGWRRDLLGKRENHSSILITIYNSIHAVRCVRVYIHVYARIYVAPRRAVRMVNVVREEDDDDELPTCYGDFCVRISLTYTLFSSAPPISLSRHQPYRDRVSHLNLLSASLAAAPTTFGIIRVYICIFVLRFAPRLFFVSLFFGDDALPPPSLMRKWDGAARLNSRASGSTLTVYLRQNRRVFLMSKVKFVDDFCPLRRSHTYASLSHRPQIN